MVAFYLGYRQLIASKKPAFLKIVLLAIISFQILNLVCNYSLKENKTTEPANQYNMAYYIKSEQLPDKAVWDFMKEYTSDVHI